MIKQSCDLTFKEIHDVCFLNYQGFDLYDYDFHNWFEFQFVNGLESVEVQINEETQTAIIDSDVQFFDGILIERGFM